MNKEVAEPRAIPPLDPRHLLAKTLIICGVELSRVTSVQTGVRHRHATTCLYVYAQQARQEFYEKLVEPFKRFLYRRVICDESPK